MFAELISYFQFNTLFYEKNVGKLNQYLQNSREKNLNVIHLRLEDDGIEHWRIFNKMENNEYKMALENKYINIIKKYINKSDQNLILCNDYNNNVMQFLKDYDYSIFYFEKEYPCRELNAINDLILGTKCNHIFIGNFNIHTSQGSSFDYIIWKKLPDNVTKIFIDLENLCSNEEIINLPITSTFT
jgi:hypothetical protein